MPATDLKGPCSYGMPGNRPCGDPEIRSFVEGPRCRIHTRRALAGLPECTPPEPRPIPTDPEKEP